jgi:hypothetical protein
MASRTYENYQTTTPVVNEYCLMVPFFQNTGSVLSLARFLHQMVVCAEAGYVRS